MQHYGYLDPGTERGLLDGTAYAYGSEHSVYQTADGWILALCHDGVGLMRYWSANSRAEILVFAGIVDTYQEIIY